MILNCVTFALFVVNQNSMKLLPCQKSKFSFDVAEPKMKSGLTMEPSPGNGPKEEIPAEP